MRHPGTRLDPFAKKLLVVRHNRKLLPHISSMGSSVPRMHGVRIFMFSKQATPSPDENNNEAARKPSDVETAVEKLNQVTGARTQPGPQGGLQS